MIDFVIYRRPRFDLEFDPTKRPDQGIIKYMPYIEQCEDGFGFTYTKTEHYMSDNEDDYEEGSQEEAEQGEDQGYIQAYLASKGK